MIELHLPLPVPPVTAPPRQEPEPRRVIIIRPDADDTDDTDIIILHF